jgi:hypothetical protein
MVVECRAHAGQIVQAIKDAEAGDWMVLSGVEAQRYGEAVRGPSGEFRDVRIIVGIGEHDRIARTLSLLAEAVHQDHACPNCAAYVWKADRVPFTTPPMAESDKAVVAKE